jgi:hypothetical protein
LQVGYPPSSPSLALRKDAKLVAMIEGKTAEQVASDLAQRFTRHCSRPSPSFPAREFATLEFALACGSSVPR